MINDFVATHVAKNEYLLTHPHALTNWLHHRYGVDEFALVHVQGYHVVGCDLFKDLKVDNHLADCLLLL